MAFFDLFERAADNVSAGALELEALINDFPNASAHNDRIQDIEHAGDDLTHEILATLNTAFVPPFDRDDIYELAVSLDDILDVVEAVADLLVLHRIEEAFPEFRLQVEWLVRATAAIARAMRHLRSLVGIKPIWIEILRMEREADRIFRRGVAELFAGDYKAMDVLKWKDMLQQMEDAADRCEDIANAIESISLKYA